MLILTTDNRHISLDSRTCSCLVQVKFSVAKENSSHLYILAIVGSNDNWNCPFLYIFLVVHTTGNLILNSNIIKNIFLILNLILTYILLCSFQLIGK